MPAYRNATTQRRLIRRLGIVVEPGEMFMSDREISDANFPEVKEKAGAKATGKED